MNEYRNAKRGGEEMDPDMKEKRKEEKLKNKRIERNSKIKWMKE